MKHPIKNQTKHQRSWKFEGLYRWTFNQAIIGLFLMVTVPLLLLFFHAGYMVYSGCVFIVVWITGMTLWSIMSVRRTQEIRSRTASPVAVDAGFLIQVFYDHNSRELQIYVRNALLKSLSCIQPIDYNLFNNAQRKFLNKALLQDDTELAWAVLSAWVYIGGKDAIPFVAQLAAGKAGAASSPRLQRSAQECLLVLQERAAQENNPGTLLRASSASVLPDELLRSASGVVKSMPEEAAHLLRPTVGQDDAPNG